jgi:hypothetical protein
VTLAGAEAVVADGIAAADDPCDGAGREDVETDQLTEVTERAESSTTRMAPATKVISTVGRGLMNSSTRCLVVHLGWLLGRTLAGERGLHVLNLPSGSHTVFGTPASEQECPVIQPFVVDNIGLLPGAHQPGGCALRSGRAISWHRLSPADHGEHPRGPI